MNPAPFNPYAAPKAVSFDKALSNCWRKGKVVVVPHGHDLPARCVKCNASAEMEKPRKFAWHHPGWYLFILANLILYAVIAMLVQKKAKVAFALCEEHRAKRRNFQIVAWVIFVLGMLLVGTAIGMTDNDNAGLFGASGGGLLLLAIIVGVIGSRVLHATQITKVETRLKGCCSAFLDELPSDSPNPVLRF
ncbi:hypothetical protein [Massilia sp. CF038]|uniref:hypothetical protein n=1 Tax=Massilia sp. CF038 TaxID=1881045 RepID=UPI000915695C|nr:hypothetical protein [Massilia sp. CF038]SHH14560.1 hypothetical protein SAMN05428948_3013 [Massilia sp. CF038]